MFYCKFKYINTAGTAFDKKKYSNDHKYFFTLFCRRWNTNYFAKEQRSLGFSFRCFNVVKLMMKDENHLEGRRKTNLVVFTEIYQKICVSTQWKGITQTASVFSWIIIPLVAVKYFKHHLTLQWFHWKAQGTHTCAETSTSQYCDLKIII